MADVLFAGGAAAVGLYLLKQKPEKQEGAASNLEKNLDEHGAMLPTGNAVYAPEIDASRIMGEPPKELLGEEPPEGWSEDYEKNAEFMEYIRTPGGIAAFSQYKKRHVSHHHANKMMAFYYYYLRIKKPSDRVKRAIRGVNSRTTVNALVTTNQALNPNRTNQYRDRGNTAPYLASFIGKRSSITKNPSNVDRSPYTIKGYTPIRHLGIKKDSRGFRSDFDPEFVNFVPNSVISNKVRHQNTQPRPKKVDTFKIHGKNLVADAINSGVGLQKRVFKKITQ
jgi:hypothetical protein